MDLRVLLIGGAEADYRCEQMPVMRLDVLRRICVRIKARRYLEYGLVGGCLAQVVCPFRWGVDTHDNPGHVPGTELSSGMTLAGFVDRHPLEKFDLILLNAAHEHHEALADIERALAMLGDDGVLVVHNCNPTTEAMQVWPPVQGESTGNTWRAIIELRRTRRDLTVGVIPDNYGIGVILKRPSPTPDFTVSGDMTYARLAAERQELLNLIPPGRWERWFVETYGGRFTLTLGVPTLFRYDLLTQMLRSAKESSIVPDRWHIVDNGGGKARSHVEQLDLPGEVVITEPNRNLGVAASWNLLIDAAPDEIVLMNDDIVLHPDTISCLLSSSAPIVCGYGFGCFLQRPEALNLFGYYDENFYPACWEDTDYQYRMHVAGYGPASVCGRSTHFTSSTTSTLNLSTKKLSGYYAAKWGGPFHGGAPFTTERFRIPFNGEPPAGWQLRPIHAGATPYVGW